jgi:hypothetical protein
MDRQYVAVKFHPGDKRSYTYQNDGEPVKIGDVVKVPDRKGSGWMRATVTDLPFDKPAFETKAILGKVEQPAPELPGIAAEGESDAN